MDSWWSTEEKLTSLETTVDYRWTSVANHRGWNANGDYCDTQSGYNWLLETNKGSTVVHCKELDVTGDYCEPQIDHSGQQEVEF